jgi:D-arabinose 1-dehydrogenase-like Zn-dependent alcohol dehydrogenase
MRAFVVTAPHESSVQDVEAPTAGPGQVIVDISRVGVCGTDVEFFTGEMAYLHQGNASFPIRLGHEWCGRVSAVGEAVGATCATSASKSAYEAATPVPWPNNWQCR